MYVFHEIVEILKADVKRSEIFTLFVKFAANCIGDFSATSAAGRAKRIHTEIILIGV